jgi:hypothetical protein
MLKESFYKDDKKCGHEGRKTGSIMNKIPQQFSLLVH